MIKLDKHQLDALDLLSNGSILCGGVGTGKSRTAIAYYFLKECKGQVKMNGKGDFGAMSEPKDLYIITTAKKRDKLEWQEEYSPFALSSDPKISFGGVKVVVDSWNNIAKYTGVKNAFFILDEQRLVGSGKWVKSFLKISKHNRWILLSATPGDTWSDYIPVFVANKFYKNRTEFLRDHAVYNRFTKYPKVDRYIETKKLLRLRHQITVIMEYKKTTIPHDKIITTEYNKDLFKQALSKRWNVFKEKPIKSIAELCYILRKIVNMDSSRVDALFKLLEAHPKTIIFYNFDYELDILRQVGKTLKIKTAEWNGHNHDEVPETKKWIYLVQYTAGAEGWNCIQTDTIIFYSQNYSYKTKIQAAGRIDRLNTPFTDLYYYHLTSKSPIDISISRALSQKKSFNASKFVKK